MNSIYRTQHAEMNIFSRDSFNHFPAQYVIVDVGIPTPALITENVLTAVQNMVCLGRSQVPVMGVALVNSVFQQVVSLSSTRAQLQKILRSLKSVTDTGKCRARISMQEFQDNVHIGINRALEDFQSLPERLDENEPCPSVLQITILSMKNGTEIQKQVEQVLKLIACEKLQKVQVVELIEDYMEPHLCLDFSNNRGFVELCRVHGSVAGLDQLFKQWLVRAASHQEHVRVVLPDCQVLCDIRECLVRPNSPTDQNIGSFAEVLVLKVTHRMSSDGLCMTQLWGDPVTLLPTRSSQLNWASQQINQQYFSALTEKVMNADEYLVTKCEQNGKPLSYFILMPGEGLLVMKCLVAAEMAMPSTESPSNCVTPQVNDHISDALVSVPTIQSYSPADFPSGLYKHLAQSALHPDKPQVKLTCKVDTDVSDFVKIKVELDCSCIKIVEDYSDIMLKQILFTSRQVEFASEKHECEFNLNLVEEEERLCRDPSHDKIVVGIEIKKTTKRKRLSGGRAKKNALHDLPKLTSSDQQTLTELLARKKIIPTLTSLKSYSLQQ